MAWEVDKLSRTLFLVKHPGSEGKTFYTIYPMMRVTTATGTTYMEPVPNRSLAGGIGDVFKFNAVEFIDAPGTDRTEFANELELNRAAFDGVRAS